MLLTKRCDQCVVFLLSRVVLVDTETHGGTAILCFPALAVAFCAAQYGLAAGPSYGTAVECPIQRKIGQRRFDGHDSASSRN